MRLERGHWIYLCKENNYAQVAMPFDPPEPGMRSGFLAIQPTWGEPMKPASWGFKSIEIWHATPDGAGLDGRQLFLPIEGNLLEEPRSVKRSDILMKLDDLNKRVENLERDYLRSAIKDMSHGREGNN